LSVLLEKGHAIETALLRVHSGIIHSIESGNGIVLIFIDLSAAFDTISHVSLLSLLIKVIGVYSKHIAGFSHIYLGMHRMCLFMPLF
jgi:hypothetical protein